MLAFCRSVNKSDEGANRLPVDWFLAGVFRYGEESTPALAKVKVRTNTMRDATARTGSFAVT